MTARPVCEEPIFIIGSPRSGTSILAWSLAEHPALWTSGETHLMFALLGAGRIEDVYRELQALPDGWLATERVQLAELLGYLGLGFNMLFSSRAGGRRWIDQTPVHTLMVDVLADMFPRAKFVHMLRDGRDVVDSMIKFGRAVSGEERQILGTINMWPPWATDFAEACRTWRDHVARAIAFASRAGERCLTVPYQQLVRQPEPLFGQIFSFLELDDVETAACFFRSNRLHSSHQPVSRIDVATGWRRWPVARQRTFIDEAGSALVSAGFVSGEELASWSDDLKQVNPLGT